MKTTLIYKLLQCFVSIQIFAGQVLASEACFQYAAEDQNRLPFRVFQSDRLPVRSGLLAQESETYPATDFTHMNPANSPVPTFTEGALGFNLSMNQWANFCVDFAVNPSAECLNRTKHKGNDYPKPVNAPVSGREIRPVFTSHAKANACTLAQTMHKLGELPSRVGTVVTQANLRSFDRGTGSDAELIRERRVVRIPWAGNVEKDYFVDLCILDSGNKANPKAVFLDYEVGDFRRESSTLELLQALRSFLHSKNVELYMFTNNLERAATVHGLGPGNIRQVLNLVDAFSYVVYDGISTNGVEKAPKCPTQTYLTSFYSGLSKIKNGSSLSAQERRKIFPMVGLLNLTQNNARRLHTAILAEGMGGLRIWKHESELLGECKVGETKTIQTKVIGCLTLKDGACTDNVEFVPPRLPPGPDGEQARRDWSEILRTCDMSKYR